ncbi:hypothetical protein D3C71_349040 [compost metagenome]
MEGHKRQALSSSKLRGFDFLNSCSSQAEASYQVFKHNTFPSIQGLCSNAYAEIKNELLL